jgi:hypothetical protein
MEEQFRPAAVEAFERSLVEQNAPLIESWKHVLDSDKAPVVKGAYSRYALARLLESTNRVLAREATQTTTVFGTNYQKTMLGMTRQIWPRMFGQQLVSVQPMDRPTGQIFHLALTRDDGSTEGVRPTDDASTWNASRYGVSRTYSDHTTGEGGEIQKGMALSITSSSVEVTKVKKLKVAASWELETDLAAYHNLNALDLLQGAATDQIAYEIDADIVRAVRNAAIAHRTVTFGPAPSGYPVEKWPTRLQRAILMADRAVNKASLRQPNVMVVGYDAMTELMDLNTFIFAPAPGWDQGSYGLVPVGSFNGVYNVFLSRTIPDNEILLGRKGSGFLDAGIVYAPYVALFITDRFFDVETQKTTQSFASRYDLFTMSNTSYARVVLDPNAPAGIA